MGDTANPDIVEHISPLGFRPTVAILTAAIARAGMTLFAIIDHAASAAEAGLLMPPTMVLIYGNPKGGTPVMLKTPSAALDLPLRVLVREDSTLGVVVAFHPVTKMLERAGVDPVVAAKLEPAQQSLLGEINAHKSGR
jgi:uncharacterized protein (DUF302 family)